MFPEVILFVCFLALSLFPYFVLLCLFLFYLISSISILDTYLYTNRKGVDLDGWRSRKYLGGVGDRETLLRIYGKILFSIKKYIMPCGQSQSV